jgi:hypothetical protein
MASKRKIQEQDIAQELILDTDFDEQLSEDVGLSPSLNDTNTDSNKEGNTIQAESTHWTDCTRLKL